MGTTRNALEWLAKDKQDLRQSKPGTVKWLRAATYIILNPAASDKEKLELLALRRKVGQDANSE